MATPGGSKKGGGAKPGKGSVSATLGGNKAAGSQAAPNVQGSSTSPCLIAYPSTSLPVVGTVGGGCIITKTNVRAWVGGLLIASGGALFIIGGVALVTAAFRKTGLADKTAAVAGMIPGGQYAAPIIRGQAPRAPRPRPAPRAQFSTLGTEPRHREREHS